MYTVGAVAAETLQAIIAKAAAGHITADLDRIAAEILATHDASSPFLNYHRCRAPKPRRLPHGAGPAGGDRILTR